MQDIDFEQCKFINEQMRILTFNDFVGNRKLLRDMFWEELDDNGRLFYMWYIYANIHMNETYKNYCWDYLNNYINDADLLYHLRFYRAR